jgi:hypothetical protein
MLSDQNMSKPEQFKYDVAISFLQEDESIARELDNLLSERLTTFVYFDRQKEIAGTDGEQTFNQVFGKESRIVVVLYRDHWGTTPWTRIEETAIRNRGYEKGYDFLTMIPLDSLQTVPEWLPKTRIWVSLERWGVAGAASVIEARVQESGGTPKQESPVEQAIRLSRRKSDEQQRSAILNCENGVRRANQEVDNLFRSIEEIASEIDTSGSNIKLLCKRSEWFHIQMSSSGYQINISWDNNNISNTLEYSRLDVYLSKRDRFSSPYAEPHKIVEEKFNFDLRLPDRYGWSRVGGDKRFFSTEQLARHCVQLLLDRLEQDQPWNSNK